MKTNFICFLFLVFVGISLADVDEDCGITSTCSDNGGSCYVKGESGCNGTILAKECESTNCSCCVEDTSICFNKTFCVNRGGSCMKTDSCSDHEYVQGCRGDGCKCCADSDDGYNGTCTMKATCSNANGTCFIKGNTFCNGTIYTAGCKGKYCACCITDPFACAPLPFCDSAGGMCKEQCGDGEKELIDGCIGIGCKCCAPE